MPEDVLASVITMSLELGHCCTSFVRRTASAGAVLTHQTRNWRISAEGVVARGDQRATRSRRLGTAGGASAVGAVELTSPQPFSHARDASGQVVAVGAEGQPEQLGRQLLRCGGLEVGP